MFMVLSSWHSHCESSPGSFDECRLSAGWPPTIRPNQPIWAVSPPKDWLLPSADTIAIYYYYSARKLMPSADTSVVFTEDRKSLARCWLLPKLLTFGPSHSLVQFSMVQVKNWLQTGSIATGSISCVRANRIKTRGLIGVARGCTPRARTDKFWGLTL